jgi:Uma2 family endonuclease
MKAFRVSSGKGSEGRREMSTITEPITVDQYEAMVASGEITPADRLVLIEGRLVNKMTMNPPHAMATGFCHAALASLLVRSGYHARAELPVRIPSRASEPEPDASVARGTFRTYASRHPSEVDIALLVEVADSSLADDRALAVTYGAASIPVYWIINLVDRQVEVYTKPDPAGGYGLRVDYRPGDDVPVVIDGREVGRIPVAELLP